MDNMQPTRNDYLHIIIFSIAMALQVGWWWSLETGQTVLGSLSGALSVGMIVSYFITLTVNHVADKTEHKRKAEVAYAAQLARSRKRNRSGYVYILKQIGGTYYKIGRTNNPDNRLATFSVKLPFEVQYEHLIKTDDMYALEAELHARYAHCRVGGEFFALSPDDLAAIKGE